MGEERDRLSERGKRDKGNLQGNGDKMHDRLIQVQLLISHKIFTCAGLNNITPTAAFTFECASQQVLCLSA